MKRHLFRGSLLIASLVLGVSLFAMACASSESTTVADAEASTVESGSIVVSGLVDYPMTFITLDTDYMDWVTVTADDPDTGSKDYDGVLLSEVFYYVGVQSDATIMAVTGYDGTTIELAFVDIDEDALLTVTDDNAFDLIMPGMGSEAWVDDVVAMDFN